jgi:hypothetical protein
LSIVFTGVAMAAKSDMYSPKSPLGVSHLDMYNNFGTVCKDCHDGSYQPFAPSLIGFKLVDMKKGPCVDCHNGEKHDLLFISLMNTKSPAYARCGDCHQVAKDKSK